MSIEMLDVLKEQAERLLMVLPGHFKDAPIEVVRSQVVQMYDFDARNPETSFRARAITSRMLNWIATYEWACASMIPRNGIDPSEIGIFRWHTWGGGKSFAIYCHDRYHYDQLHETIELKNEKYVRSSWSVHANRCFYSRALTDGEDHEG